MRSGELEEGAPTEGRPTTSRWSQRAAAPPSNWSFRRRHHSVPMANRRAFAS